MKILLTSDLHQRIEKWGALVAAVRREQPRFVLIAGDLLPKADRVDEQAAFFERMDRHLQTMKRGEPVTVFTYLGNDDAHILEPRLDELAAKGLCVNLNGRVHREDELVFCGMNKVRDYPFGYKHWCARDGSHIACPEQLCGEGLEIDPQGNYVPLSNLVDYLSAKPSLGDELNQLLQGLGAGELARSIWMIHQPPTDLGMDICHDGLRVGSPTVLRFIQEHQPLLGCSGHIHESPHQPGGHWTAQVGRTAWFQPGQVGLRLHYVCVELGADCEVLGARHSIF